MNKEKAREILEDWIMEITSCTYEIALPIIDEIIHKESDFDEWTLRGLLKLAYDLEDKK